MFSGQLVHAHSAGVYVRFSYLKLIVLLSNRLWHNDMFAWDLDIKWISLILYCLQNCLTTGGFGMKRGYNFSKFKIDWIDVIRYYSLF